MIEKYARQRIDENADVPYAVKKMVLQMQYKMQLLNEDFLRAGAQLCMRSALSALIILRDFTLMDGYDYYAYLNKPLIFTRSLKK